MNKIKNLLSKLSQDLKDLMRKFPVTMSIIIFLTLLFTVIIDQNFSRNTREILEKIEMFCMIWAVGTFFTEIFFAKRTNQMISYILTAIVSLVFVRLTYMTLSPDIAIIWEKILATYIPILILISIYKIIKNNDLTLEKYFICVFRDLLNMSIIYVILNIGFVLIVEIFNLLILDGRANMGIIKTLTLLYGLFYVPSILYSVSSINKKEMNAFIKGLVNYVLLPLVIIAMAIIYLYIAKILILRDMPKNVIFRILAGIFVIGFPVWNMASCYGEEKRWIGKITKILPVLYVPFIFLEMYAIGVRIQEFGVTPLRYVSCIFIVFQMICLGLTFYKNKEKLSFVLVSMAVLVFVAILTPFGYENISNLSQKKIIEKWLPENTEFAVLNETEKAKVKSAYRYLEQEVNGDKYIPEYLSEELIKEINSFYKEGKNDYVRYQYFSRRKDLNLDISDYRKISKMETNKTLYGKTTVLEINEKNLDFSDFLNQVIQKHKESKLEAENYFDENNLINLNETEDFYMEYISLRYEDEGEIETFSIEGYLLEKYK